MRVGQQESQWVGILGTLPEERSDFYLSQPSLPLISVSLLSAWIVARLRMRNYKRLQRQDRHSIMSEKLVEGVEGRPVRSRNSDGKDMT